MTCQYPGSLAPGARSTVRLVTKLVADANGSVINKAVVTGGEDGAGIRDADQASVKAPDEPGNPDGPDNPANPDNP